MIDQTANVLKALGEPTRLKIIKFLSARELCVCELVEVLGISQPRVSQHVKVLKQASLVNERKVRQNSYLSIDEAVLKDAIIIPFQTLMQTRLDKLPELKAENQRFELLEANTAVTACKEGNKRKKFSGNSNQIA
ncbi:MAG: winged helix-turn-helix transcriptional regulator [Syntrophomonadaceae bacterium]|nr:winged helix-turn-helix transcriptional regulator [Syntrophomonadaceae bacterium]